MPEDKKLIYVDEKDTDVDLYPIGEGLTDDVYASILAILADDESAIDNVDPILEGLHPADIADLLERLPLKKREKLISHIPSDYLGETLSQLGDAARETAVQQVPVEELTEATECLESDDKVDIAQSMTDEQVESAEELIDDDEKCLLEFDEDSAGGIMQVEVVTVSGDWLVGDVFDYLREHKTELPKHIDRIYVVGYKQRLLGSVSLSRLVRKRLDRAMSDVMRTDMVTVDPYMPKEDVAHLFEKYDIYSCGVVDHNMSLMGVITIDDILDVVIEEQEADVMRAAGMEEGQDIFAPVLHTSRKRFTWLFINLWTAILASYVISQFEAQIDQLVALAVLMPIVASMGGNAGTQSMTVAVRGLATKQLTWQNAGHLLWKEVRVGGFNGLILAFILSLGTAFIYDNPHLGAVIAAATVINHILAALAGIAIPVLLEKWGKDPAVSSGVLLTTVTDVVGFFSFLGLAAIFLL